MYECTLSLKIAASAMLWLALTACESSAVQGGTPTPAPVGCPAPAPVVAAPAGTGLADGVAMADLFLTASWRSGADFQPGYPTKVAIHARGSTSLSGRRCADGLKLRFWYREGSPPLGKLPASSSTLASTGDLVAVFDPNSSPSESYTGYILFPSAGDYALMAGPPGAKGLEAVVRVA
jgi:hypothetical protein